MSCSIIFPSASPFKARRDQATAYALPNLSVHKLPLPSMGPKNSFWSPLASSFSTPRHAPVCRSASCNTLPYLDLFESPHLRATPAEVSRTASSSSHGEKKPDTPPPDLPSMLLDGRIVYIGMPLVSAVTELVVAELLYLQFMDPKKPIYVYINSTGTARDDNQTVGMETEGFAIYDTMMLLKNEIHTVGVGVAAGHACLLLAAGAKGKRHMMPHSKAMIQQPRVPPSGLMSSSDCISQTREALHNRDTLIELLAQHTGNSPEKVANAMKRPLYMDSKKAMEFGVVDRVLWHGQKDLAQDGDDVSRSLSSFPSSQSRPRNPDR